MNSLSSSNMQPNQNIGGYMTNSIIMAQQPKQEYGKTIYSQKEVDDLTNENTKLQKDIDILNVRV